MEGYISLDKKLSALANMDLTEPLNQSCLLVENDAKRLCPVASGQLRNSIQSKVNKDTGTVYTNVEYAPYIEYGTGLFSSKGNGRKTPWVYKDAEGKFHRTTGHKPQPYMHPALTQNRQKIKTVFKNYISKVVRGI